MDESLVTVHVPLPARDRHVAVFYLHGGGLLYGERDDLPAPYVQALVDAGYTLVCADYPLCPEATLGDLFDSLAATWRAEIADRVASEEFTGYFLFGRSAGAYLSLMLARHIHALGAEAPQPLGILDFYGYYSLLDQAFYEPAAAYTALPGVSREQVARIAGDPSAMVTSGPKPLRYSLYVYARQNAGAWLELMGLNASEETEGAGNAGSASPAESSTAVSLPATSSPASPSSAASLPAVSSPATWSLSDEDIAALPPLFITASSGDEDVPMRISKTLMRKAPSAKPAWVYYLPHDFDRDTSNPAGMEVYRKALAWMDGLLA